ncbi:hypothetical protein ACFU0X_28505 [Streptomyces cellulosae]|uniref:DUF3168 domain-containing protein n=1 Tax=Streptomyces cellulosae TaxID=1968 RepID=A0ABW6JNG8_STRCE
MTALDAGTSAGKSTRASGQLPPGDATRALSLPQIPYADAVYAALLDVGLQPSAYEAGLRRGRTGTPELYVRAVWPSGAPALADPARPRGLTVAWSHVTGWAAHDADEQCALLPVDALAAPELVADAARHHAAHGIDPDQPWAPAADGRWTDAVYLDIALTRFGERPGGGW